MVSVSQTPSAVRGASLGLEGPGSYEIQGIAWSGAGRITRVEVSTDEGSTWHDAKLPGLVLPRAVTRFRMPWRWDGGEVSLQSRCTATRH